MQNNLGARVKAQRNKKGWSQAELAKKADLSQGAISQLENGTSENTRHLSAIAKALKVSTEYLTDGKGLQDYNNNLLSQYDLIGVPTDGVDTKLDSYVMISEYDVKGSCGDGNLVGDININGGFLFRRDWLESLNLKGENLATVHAQGESMSPVIEDGQLLLVDVTAKQPQSAKVYIICINGQLYIKRLINMYDKWIMRSDNADKSRYPDIELNADAMGEIDIQGRVVWQSGVL